MKVVYESSFKFMFWEDHHGSDFDDGIPVDISDVVDLMMFLNDFKVSKGV